MAKTPRRPRDPNQLARMIVDIAAGDIVEEQAAPLTPSQEFARSGGLKGGAARAASLTPEQRKEIAQKAARLRWAARSK